MFRFHTFEDKFLRHCPGRGEWNTLMTASFVNVATAVTRLATNERLYWCKHCKRGLFFPYICARHSNGHQEALSVNTRIVRICTYTARGQTSVSHPSIRLFFSVHLPLTTTANVTRSTGQGNLFSRVPSYSPCIAMGLHSRALTGRSLNINVHQHLEYRLHLVWNSTKNCVTSERSVERRFLMYEDVESFCTELVNGGSEGLCDCVGEEVLPDKAECFKARFLSQKGIPSDISKSWLKDLQESRRDKYWCTCRAKSTNMVIEWKK